MSRTTRVQIDSLIRQAAAEQRCVVGTTRPVQRGLQYMCRQGLMVSPYINLYCPAEPWQTMNGCERHLHILRALQLTHGWTAAGESAVEAHGLPHPWSMHEGLITIASAHTSSNPYGGKRYSTCRNAPATAMPVRDSRQPLRRIFVRGDEPVVVNGVRATSLPRTVVDAVMLGTFESSMEIINHVLAHGLTESELRAYCAGRRIDHARIESVLTYANPLAENGGESLVYATIIRAGFVIPEMQCEFENFDHPDYPLRVDFLWRTDDGRMIVLEYDGLRKYQDPTMTRHALQENITRQASRDQMLLAQHVTKIVHCFAEDVYQPERLIAKLDQAGVPRLPQPRALPF